MQGIQSVNKIPNLRFKLNSFNCLNFILLKQINYVLNNPEELMSLRQDKMLFSYIQSVQLGVQEGHLSCQVKIVLNLIMNILSISDYVTNIFTSLPK